ncbi:endopeptidase La [bacterium]|nr:endopeptidase La [bacterium]
MTRSTHLPLLPFRDIIIFPDSDVTYKVGRSFSKLAVDTALLTKEKHIIIVPQTDGESETPTVEELHKFGTLCEIIHVVEDEDKIYHLFLEGLSRISIDNIEFVDNSFRASAHIIETTQTKSVAKHSLILKRTIDNYLSLVGSQEDFQEDLKITNEKDVPDLVAARLLTPSIEKSVELLSTASLTKRYQLVTLFLKTEIELLKLEKSIDKKVRNHMEKTQRNYYLREQMDIIADELSENSGYNEDDEDEGEAPLSDIKKLKRSIDKLKAPEAVKEKLQEEFRRLQSLPQMGGENSVIRGYIETLLSLPWELEKQPEIDIAYAEKILERDHFGLTEIKKRVLEYLAVLKLTDSMRAPIICLVGPPGVGKTSIASSIASAVKRKFVRVALGGIHDEAEIRGHRRTYIGAMTGKIIHSLKRIKSRSPVFLLDEIDKLSSDYKGDPASALLEALDPEQNSTFVDHFVDIEFDLSAVLFIATANNRWDIPVALRDRLEIIELEGYTFYEKKNIAKKYILPKQKKINGINKIPLTITASGMQTLIENYTWEAGVRELERKIATICRKVALAHAKDNSHKRYTIKASNLFELLGKPLYDKESNAKESRVGVVHGLAWTQNGGDLLTIEAIKFPGDGSVKITGSLGDVMKESVATATSFIRSISESLLGISHQEWDKQTIHIHFPDGATPKDGPSAGLAIALAIASLITDRPVIPYLAMTGEITLQGKALKIGGLKAKVMAAKNAGIKQILIPHTNKDDLSEIPDEIKKDITFSLIENAKEVIEISLKKSKSINNNILGGMNEPARTKK